MISGLKIKAAMMGAIKGWQVSDSGGAVAFVHQVGYAAWRACGVDGVYMKGEWRKRDMAIAAACRNKAIRAAARAYNGGA